MIPGIVAIACRALYKPDFLGDKVYELWSSTINASITVHKCKVDAMEQVPIMLLLR